MAPRRTAARAKRSASARHEAIALGRLGRLAETDQRFIANTPDEPDLLGELERCDSLGRHGTVREHEGRNLFVPD